MCVRVWIYIYVHVCIYIHRYMYMCVYVYKQLYKQKYHRAMLHRYTITVPQVPLAKKDVMMQSDGLQTLLKNGSYINGKWHSAEQTFDVTNPATGELVAQVANASEDEAHTAIEAADAAFKSWSKTTANSMTRITSS